MNAVLHLRIPDDLNARLNELATAKGITVTQLMRQFAIEGVAEAGSLEERVARLEKMVAEHEKKLKDTKQ